MGFIIYSLIGCIIMAIVHLMYHQVVLPSLIQSLKFKLHKLHDEVMSMVIDDKKNIPPEEFNFTMHIIEIAFKNLSNVDLLSLFNMNDIIKEEGEGVLKSEIEEFEKQIRNERLKRINEECVEIVFKAFVRNTFMAALYLSPIFIIVYVISKVFGYSKNLKELFFNKFNNQIESDFTTINKRQQYCSF